MEKLDRPNVGLMGDPNGFIIKYFFKRERVWYSFGGVFFYTGFVKYLYSFTDID